MSLQSNLKRLSIALGILILGTSLQAQVDAVSPPQPKTIKGKFDAMLARSNRYQDFKVVKITALNNFIVEVQDSLKAGRAQYVSEIQKVNSLNKQVATLQDTISTKDNTISALTEQRDGISTAGMNMDKGTFSTLMWVAVFSLLGLLLLLLFRNKSISSSQKSLKASLAEMDEDLSSTKKRALEREQELKREVQDYINKLEAMGPPR